MVTDRQIAEQQDYGDKSLILCRFYCILLGRIAVLRTLMRPIVTDRVAWSVDLSVRRFVIVNPAKMAEPIVMPFGLCARMDSGNHY